MKKTTYIQNIKSPEDLEKAVALLDRLEEVHHTVRVDLNESEFGNFTVTVTTK